MKLSELIERLNILMLDSGAQDFDVGIQLHNTIHSVEEIVAGPEMFYLKRTTKPSYVWDHKYEWRKIP
jgi:hypothetical protein